uniref:PLA2c domain-containing protein n=1 Tax=Labrus bergylta TaxID=56723 RepID=A0A3Q3F124_9LABR
NLYPAFRELHVLISGLIVRKYPPSKATVPHIAVLGSGGGQRAAVSLLGSLHQMEKDGLLDSVLYLGGVSGSVWSMASLYTDPQWSKNVGGAVSRLSGPEISPEQVLSWLSEAAKDEQFSLSDIWGLLTSAGIMKQLDHQRLSGVVTNAVNPYPIYNAMNQNCKWFELTPHESGFTDLGLFVNSSLLGSRVHEAASGGQREMDLVRLQGECDLSLLQTKSSKHEELRRDTNIDKNFQRDRTNQSGFKGRMLETSADCCVVFLCCCEDASVPSCVRLKQRLQLIDAGLMLNMAFPPLLGEKREVDLLIALDYSASEAFTVRDYAAKLKKPFPEIDEKILLEERDCPKDFYVFEGKEKEPTIVFMRSSTETTAKVSHNNNNNNTTSTTTSNNNNINTTQQTTTTTKTTTTTQQPH